MKRFYKEAGVQQAGGSWQVFLDKHALKTQGGRPQIVPSRTLADALAAEWNGQGEEIDPASFTFRDTTDYALDIVAPDPAAMVDTLVKYAETDTLCYRAEPEDALFARQEAEWEPILSGVEAREGVRFARVSGIMHQPQPDATLTRLRSALQSYDAVSYTHLTLPTNREV